jgi:hypothetical protein
MPSPPLVFTDEEMDSISALASALPSFTRARFLQQLASQLALYPPQARGPGLVHRLGVEAQRQFLRSGPVAVGAGGKYGRR